MSFFLLGIVVFAVGISLSSGQSWGQTLDVNINFGDINATGRFELEELTQISGNTWTHVDPNASIGGAEEKNRLALQSHRYGVEGAVWNYSMTGLNPGYWDCTIHFAEISPMYFGAGLRVFNVAMVPPGGEPETREIDVYAMVGAYTSYTETFVRIPTWTSRYAPIIFSFQGGIAGDAFASAITCAVRECTDKFGNTIDCLDMPNRAIFAYDVGGTFSGGSLMPVESTYITGVASSFEREAAIAQLRFSGSGDEYTTALTSHMYGKEWGLSIPKVQSGVYDCTTYHAEIYQSNFEVGKRVFNLEVEGQTHYNIDVFSAVGGNKMHTETFSGVVPTADNRINIRLTSIVGESFLSAVHCVKTGDALIAVQGNPWE